MSFRDDILSKTRDWMGTPYRHQASVKHVGTDCLGLIRGVWRDVIGAEPELPPPYTPDWAEKTGEDRLLDVFRKHFVEKPISAAEPGDVLLFRMGLGCPAKHAAIVSGPGRIIHAYWGRSVCETRLVPWWERRIVGCFCYPNPSSGQALERSNRSSESIWRQRGRGEVDKVGLDFLSHLTLDSSPPQ